MTGLNDLSAVVKTMGSDIQRDIAQQNVRINGIEDRLTRLECGSSAPSTVPPPGLTHQPEECIWLAGGWKAANEAQDAQKELMKIKVPALDTWT
eukprot:3139965-Amphidinium_carterae.1